MDMQLTDGTGTEATTAVLEVSPKTRILVLSASGERDDVLEAVKAGASGYLVKSSSREELVDAVRATADGQAVFTPGLAGLVLCEYRRMSQQPDAAPAAPALTERETEVLRLVAKGLSAKQIARRLDIGEATVKTHVSRVLMKLGVQSRVQAAVVAAQSGLN